MRHYRCRTCDAVFAAEPADERPMPNTVFCVFCGDEAKAFESLYGIAGIVRSGRHADLLPGRVSRD